MDVSHNAGGLNTVSMGNNLTVTHTGCWYIDVLKISLNGIQRKDWPLTSAMLFGDKSRELGDNQSEE